MAKSTNNVTDVSKELNRLKDMIKEKENSLARVEGRSQEINKRLRTEFNCTTETAEKKINDLTKRRDRLHTKIMKMFNELKGLYDW